MQGRAHLAFLAVALPQLRRVLLCDASETAVRAAIAEASALGHAAEAVDDLAAACRTSDVCITCTPSRRTLLDAATRRAFVPESAPTRDKHELAPALLARSTVVVDVLTQCEHAGDLHHALAAGALRRDDVHAELGEIIAGHKTGRRSADEVIVFDSTGMALQDVAASVVVYERAVAAGRGTAFALAR